MGLPCVACFYKDNPTAQDVEDADCPERGVVGEHDLGVGAAKLADRATELGCLGDDVVGDDVDDAVGDAVDDGKTCGMSGQCVKQQAYQEEQKEECWEPIGLCWLECRDGVVVATDTLQHQYITSAKPTVLASGRGQTHATQKEGFCSSLDSNIITGMMIV